jgi:nucleotide-binding universal stress UspA family protein
MIAEPGGTVFNSVVVPVDLNTAGNRALPIARALGRLGSVPVEVLAVVSPGGGGGLDPRGLDEHVRQHGLGPHSTTVLQHDEPGLAITEHVSGRDGALLVLATTAKAALDESYAGSVSEYVLSTLRQPVLLVGPRVDPDRGLASPNLVVAVDGSGLDAVALPVSASWMRTFGGGRPTFVEVIPFVPAIADHAGPALEAANVRDRVDRLATFGIDAGGDVIYGEEPASALADHAEHLESAVLVVTAERWPGAGTHWRMTSRKLAFGSSSPVLVVPADLAARG